MSEILIGVLTFDHHERRVMIIILQKYNISRAAGKEGVDEVD